MKNNKVINTILIISYILIYSLISLSLTNENISFFENYLIVFSDYMNFSKSIIISIYISVSFIISFSIIYDKLTDYYSIDKLYEIVRYKNVSIYIRKIITKITSYAILIATIKSVTILFAIFLTNKQKHINIEYLKLVYSILQHAALLVVFALISLILFKYTNKLAFVVTILIYNILSIPNFISKFNKFSLLYLFGVHREKYLIYQEIKRVIIIMIIYIILFYFIKISKIELLEMRKNNE